MGGTAVVTRPMPVVELLLGVSPSSRPDLAQVVSAAEALVGRMPEETLWLPYLGDALDAGACAALSEEVILAAAGTESAFAEPQVRDLLERFRVAERPPLILVLGSPPSPAAAARLYGDLVSKDALALACGPFGHLLAQAGVEPAPRHLLELGADIAHAADVFGLIVRMARAAGVDEDVPGLRSWVERELLAFVMVLGTLEPEPSATVAAGVTFGMSSVGEVYIPQLLPIHSLP